MLDSLEQIDNLRANKHITQTSVDKQNIWSTVYEYSRRSIVKQTN